MATYYLLRTRLGREFFRVASMSWSHSTCGLLLLGLLLGGCTGSTQDRLQGHWVGRPHPAVTPGSPAELASGSPQVELGLEFTGPHQFAMTLRDGQGQADRRTGRYHVLRVYGPRWDVELTASDPAERILLEIVFRGDDQMTVRDVHGDHRLGQFTFERLADRKSSGAMYRN
jgi:hypothetical protein